MARRATYLYITLTLLMLGISPANAGLFFDDVDYKVEIDDLSPESKDNPQNEPIKELQEIIGEGILKFEEKDEEMQESHLHRNAKENEERINQILRSQGYYKAEITYNINMEADKPEISFNITPGTPLTIDDIKIELSPDNPTERITPPENTEIKLKAGDILIAENILAAQETIKKHVEKDNCIKAALVERNIMADYQAYKAQVTFTVTTSARVNFGKTSFEGLETIEGPFLADMTEWQEGECFNKEKLTKTQNKLLQSNLLANAEYELKENNNNIDIIFKVTERKHRTIKAGIRFDTDEGPGVSAEWQHRNFFSEGQNLTVGTNLSNLFKTLYAKFDQPVFLRNDQSLNITAQLQEENLDAFDALSFDISTTVRRQLNDLWAVGSGLQYSLSEVDKAGDKELFGLFGIPFFVERDSRNDVFDPQKGSNFRAKATPFVDTLDTTTSFVKMESEASYYYTFERAKWTPTLALRGALGSITGTTLGRIPADERFYAGGGGSVRGYGFQKLGDLTGGIPDGGRSFAEISTEARLRFTETIGGVVFVDGGNAYEAEFPDDEVRWAAGIGARYYTDFAPIRLDVAVPLDRREEIDDEFQIYISIGQAF